MESITITRFSPSQHAHLIPAILQMHINCIQSDGALLRFHPPFTPAKRHKMETFWNERLLSQISSGRRIALIALAASNIEGSDDVAGIVELGMPDADTGPFRGDLEMLMVSPKYRRRGLGVKLINDVEEIAREEKRTLLQLSTDVGSTAEKYVYPRLGYALMGTVPKYGISPLDGSLKDGAFFYKHLAELN
ncbi:acyl-CoA N-acyltransferase [Trichoderma citrinoviride]|uniref:Acyl-CoA N-acyltransferase n=1 Tax=Trichoderma citrinoviride TaxID=58853 RepID=A0A2T4AYS4_9HYPO|nr:acyl-CoA N-acyltransferase [Trichoderma citrinoviride]PTB62223.1 acyl-CoA N-acyltransferase [Trichoderma citrinoviride]